MAKKTKPKGRPAPPVARPVAPAQPLEVVDPVWMIKAVAVCVLAAAFLGYLTVCLLIYQGSWQLMLHPSRKLDRTPAALAIPFDALRFDAAETGVPRLAAWWIAASRPNAPTILFLHDGKGCLSANVDLLAALHQADVNIFAIDYRGYGESDPEHPSEVRMNQDAAAALDYLVNTRHVPAAAIVPYGLGLGASLAANLAAAHPELPAVIVDNPDPGAGQRVLDAEQSRFIPVALLLRDRFDLASVLATVKQPKLLLSGGGQDTQPELDSSRRTLFKAAPAPKLTVELPAPKTSAFDPSKVQFDYVQGVDRFLDEYLLGSQTVTPRVTLPAPTAPK